MVRKGSKTFMGRTLKELILESRKQRESIFKRLNKIVDEASEILEALDRDEERAQIIERKLNGLMGDFKDSVLIGQEMVRQLSSGTRTPR